MPRMQILWRCACLAIFLLALPTPQRGQFEPANPIQLTVRLYVNSLLNPASSGLTVQLMDGLGTLEKESRTDSSGRVDFQTKTSTKRLRVFGPGVEDQTETVEIEAMESRKTVSIILKPKSMPGVGTALASGAPVIPASRLKAPDKAEKEFHKGSDALAKKDWPEARKHFEAATTIYPDYDVAYNGLGAALMASGDAKSARAAFEKAIALNDDFAEAYRNLARISLAERNYEELEN
jgi:tetratricopeptide (TPR) repeat protein